MFLRSISPVLLTLTLALAGMGCDSREPARLSIAVRASSAALATTTTSDGWTVTLSGVRLAVGDLELTQLGEGHARAHPGLLGWILPAAHAHPGHEAGGTVTGTLPGAHLLSFPGDGTQLGTATVLEGRYRGMNFSFRAASSEDVGSDDPLRDLSAQLVGTASRGGQVVPFEARLEFLAATRVVGGVFETTFGPEAAGVLEWELLPHDAIADASLFEGLDFAALPREDGEPARILPGEPAHNILRRSLQDHAFHRLTFRSEH